MTRNTRQNRPARIDHLEKVDFRTLADEISNTGDWLVEPLIPAGRATALVAAAGVGKSLLMLEVAAALATGLPILDRPAGPPVSVNYIDQEMTLEDLAQRLTDLGYDYANDETLRKHLNYYHLQDFEPFDKPAGGRQLLALAQKHRAELVIIDTLAGVVSGEENSADTYRKFARHTGQPLKAEGVAVVRLDHLGKNKGKGPRGSSAKRDDVDLAWTMTAKRNGTVLNLSVDKRRMNWVPNEINLRRTDNSPLRHIIVDESLTRDEKALLSQLDDLGIPDGTGRDRARDAMKKADISASNDSLARVLRVRNARSGQQPGQNTWQKAGQRRRTGHRSDG